MDELTQHDSAEHEIKAIENLESPEQNPYYIYLARLSSGSRPAMSESLATAARIASSGRFEADRSRGAISGISMYRPSEPF